MSKSSISRSFIDRTEEKLKEFESRSLEPLQIIALFIDGKYLSKEQIIICMGGTLQGEKIPLGFVQSTTENSVPIKDMLTNLKERGLAWEEGLLCVIDGSKGIRKALEESFGDKAVIQRCQWHKQENILKYIPEKDQQAVKRKYQQSVNKESYKEVRESLKDLKQDLEKINLSAARSLEEGLEEILTLHRLGLNEDFSRSFATTIKHRFWPWPNMCFVLNETGFFGRYTLYIVESIFQAFSELKIAEKVNTKIMKRNRYHKLGHTKIFRGVISMM